MKPGPSNPPLLLLILDGWGYREETDGNAILAAHTPVWDRLWAESPRSLIRTSGAAVGLPGGQMGNSEVGHLNLGAGRVVYQEFTRVSRSIRTGSFFSNQTLTGAVDAAIERGSALHVLGLLSPGGVHSHEDQIHAMLRLAVERGLSRVYLHAFLDGRDTPPQSAMASLQGAEGLFAQLGQGRIASLIGRYYAMDRDHRWPRIQAAYELISEGRGAFRADSACAALQAAYARGESDEFVQASCITAEGAAPLTLNDDDVVVFMNYRSDRARQITRPFIEADFSGFERRRWPRLARFVSLTEYSREFDIPIAYPPERLHNVLGETIAKQGLRQLRLAETEKYAHVTFFFNGGREEPFDGEERILVASPQVATYDQRPQMSAAEVTERLLQAIQAERYDVIICNYANPDMVGHSGNLEATRCAIEALDACLGQVVQALRASGGQMLISADHGNAEQMIDRRNQQPHTAHTSNPVPLVYVGPRRLRLAQQGALCDIAPTLLQLMGLKQPAEMSGQGLIQDQEQDPHRASETAP
ncbi:MAG: 2,3-bisphosphoglycerate-independent phosphoglycerate mutase [Gammaproteobacteria bacterium SHHR-1]